MGWNKMQVEMWKYTFSNQHMFALNSNIVQRQLSAWGQGQAL